jgi:hypothetical protein
MNIVGPGQPKVFFRKVERLDSEEICLDADMIRLLIAIDETKDMVQTAKEVGMDLTTLNQTLKKLVELRLIEPIKRDSPHLNKRFFMALRINLSKAVGPMAEILIEDVMAELAMKPSAIPKNQAAELISTLSLEVPDEEARIQFKKEMLEIIKKGQR